MRYKLQHVTILADGVSRDLSPPTKSNAWTILSFDVQYPKKDETLVRAVLLWGIYDPIARDEEEFEDTN